MAPLPTQSTSQQTERQPLRRATYVHVSDLISAYNIDHVQLEREIARVNSKRSKLLHTSGTDAATTSEKMGAEKTDLAIANEVISDSTRDGCIDSSSDGVPAPDEDADLGSPALPQKKATATSGRVQPLCPCG